MDLRVPGKQGSADSATALISPLLATSEIPDKIEVASVCSVAVAAAWCLEVLHSWKAGRWHMTGLEPPQTADNSHSGYSATSCNEQAGTY